MDGGLGGTKNTDGLGGTKNMDGFCGGGKR